VLASKITFYTVHAEEIVSENEVTVGGKRAPDDSIE
jgi:hypothetical protein